MHKVYWCLLYLCVICCSSQSILAQRHAIKGITNTKSELETDEEIKKRIKIQRLIMSYASLKRFSGVVLVAKKGTPVYKYTTGFANLDYRVQCALSTRFNMANVTQTMTAIAILQLAEQGRIDLYAPIAAYFPDFPPEVSSTITIHHLLTHTSGLMDYYNMDEYIEYFLDIDNIGDLIALILSKPMEFTPGTRYKVSNSGYVLLAAIIERMSGVSYPKYIKKNIFSKAKMKDSGLYTWSESVDNKAIGYTKDSRLGLSTSPDFWGAYPFGADAIYCDIEDLLAFGQALNGTSLLSEEYKELMYTPYIKGDTITNDETWKYDVGYGWHVKDINGKRVYHQGGAIDGLSVQFRRYIDTDYTVMVLSNRYEKIAEKIAIEIEKIFHDDAYIMPSHPISFFIYEKMREQGVDEVLANFDDILSDNGFALERVWSLSALGRELSRADKLPTALKLYKLNAQKFPEDPVVWDDLGSCYFTLKNYDLALLNYQKRLKFLPNDRRSKAMIKVIEEEIQLAQEKKQKTDASLATNNAITKPVTPAPVQQETKKETLVKDIPVDTKQVDEPLIMEEEKVLVSTPNADNSQDINLVDTPDSTPPNDLSTSTTASIGEVAEANTAPKSEETIYTVVDKMPKFPGGQVSIFDYISNNLQYPEKAQKNKTQGTVHVNFVVNEIGDIENVRIKKGLPKDDGCNEEAIRLVSDMPKWTPGYQNGRAVKVSYTIPVRFQLN